MVLPSKRFSLFNQLYERYALEPYPASAEPSSAVSPNLYPVIDISDLYPVERLEAALNLDVTAGTFISGFTVPANQRWQLVWIDTDGADANTSLTLRDPGGALVTLTIGSTAIRLLGQEISHIILDAGWEVGQTATDAIGDNARGLRMIIRRERLN